MEQAMNKLAGWRLAMTLLLTIIAPAQGEEAEREVRPRNPQDWSYSGDSGPDHWGEMGFPQCLTGRKQSPVDFATQRKTVQADLDLDYHSSLLRILNSGRTVRVVYEPGSSLKYGDRRYELTQFQFHTPSEHTLGGRTYPMEIQLLHRSAEGRMVQLAVFVTEGDQTANGTVEAIFSALPLKVGLELIGNFYLNAADILPREKTAYFYIGSLTTPPCTEGVAWYVFKEPLHLPANLISRMASLLGKNTRPIQKMLIDKPPETKGKKNEPGKRPGSGR